MSQKTYLTIIKTGIYLSFLSVFLVFGKLFFPYITSKQIFFNILIEVLSVFWLVFIIKYPEWRPKFSYISVGLLGFILAIALSSFFSVDFNLSFWGDAERMLGVFHVAHFIIYYFIIITVFRCWSDWRNLFIISIIASALVSLYGQLAGIIYSTIGNTAYVSGYAIFNIYFALILYFRLIKNKAKEYYYWAGAALGLAILILISVFRITHTRGAYVGLGASFILMLLLVVFLGKSKRVKIWSLGFIVLIIVLVSLVFSFSKSNFVSQSSVLSTITQISLDTATFQTRLIAWKAAWRDFRNHPILGSGHGNFAITFDKYFDPTFYNYTRSETYFDRAHNNIVDIASTTGILGLVTYLSILASAFYYLIKSRLKKIIGRVEFIFIISLLVAYFIQNLAVFDSLVTYISLMVILAYIFWISSEEKGAEIGENRKLNNQEIFLLSGIGLIMILIIFQYNFKPLKSFAGAINGQLALAQNDLIGGYEAYKKTLAINSVLDRDVRDSFAKTLASKSPLLDTIDQEKAREILNFAVEAVKKNIAYNNDDSLTQFELAKILDITSRYYTEDQEKFYYYSEQAIEAIDRSIELSPGRIPVYYVKAQIEAARGEKDKAFETLNYALSLNKDYYDSYCNLARFYFYYKDEENGFKNMDQCLDLGGAELLFGTDYVGSLMNHYAETKDLVKLRYLYERYTVIDPTKVQAWINLAKLYAQAGEKEKAIATAEKAAELDENLEQSVGEFINSLNNLE